MLRAGVAASGPAGPPAEGGSFKVLGPRGLERLGEGGVVSLELGG